MSDFTLYAGAPEPAWLARAGLPLFVSRNRLVRQRQVRPAIGRWALDSGGFTEISKHGRWTTPPQQYAGEVRQWQAQIGRLDWAAIQDWMCEPAMLAKTGKTVQQHQDLTCESYLQLIAIAPALPWLPVLQGWEAEDYYRHVQQYRRLGVDLTTFSVVGIGSVCRRQATQEAETIIRTLHAMGIRLHGFGFKLSGLRRVWRHLVSSDSMAWSFHARKHNLKLGLCTHSDCRNCLCAAADWRQRVCCRLQGQVLCPECGSEETCPPVSDVPIWSCADCGQHWPMQLGDQRNSYSWCPPEGALT